MTQQLLKTRVSIQLTLKGCPSHITDHFTKVSSSTYLFYVRVCVCVCAFAWVSDQRHGDMNEIEKSIVESIIDILSNINVRTCSNEHDTRLHIPKPKNWHARDLHSGPKQDSFNASFDRGVASIGSLPCQNLFCALVRTQISISSSLERQGKMMKDQHLLIACLRNVSCRNDTYLCCCRSCCVSFSEWVNE